MQCERVVHLYEMSIRFGKEERKNVDELVEAILEGVSYTVDETGTKENGWASIRRIELKRTRDQNETLTLTLEHEDTITYLTLKQKSH